MGKHTPEPWRVERNGLSGYGDNGNTFNIRAGGKGRGGKLIASLPSAFRLLDRDSVEDADYIEEQAHARLIAAAPELLDAVKDLLGEAPLIDAHTCQCRFCGRDYSGEEAPLNLYECAEGSIEDGGCPGMVARAAIAKATGGA